MQESGSSSRASGPAAANFLPGLEALRAIAVLAVVLFHLELAFVPGGFFGVSLFFTLSGFLITRNLLAEIDRTDRISLRRFWARRARRLFPAAWFVLAVIAATAALSPSIGHGIGFRGGDLLSAFANVANWRFLSTGSSYASLFQSPSPVLHFWSLAIEEQAYVIVALLVAGLAWARRSRAGRALLLTSVALACVSWVLPFATSMSVTRTYYGTDTRIGEILAGVALAAADHVYACRIRPSRAAGRWLTVLALLAFVGLIGRTSASSEGISQGLLPLMSLVSCALIVASIDSQSALARLGTARMIAKVGQLSYVIYLVHWPLLLFLKWKNVDTHQAPVALLVVGLCGFLAWAIVRVVEQPIRSGRRSNLTIGFSGVISATVIFGAATWWQLPASATDRTLAGLEKAASIANGTGAIPRAVRQTTEVQDDLVTLPPGSVAPAASSLPAKRTVDSVLGNEAMEPRPLVVRAYGDSILLSLMMSVPRGGQLRPIQGAHDLELGCGITDFGGDQMLPECVDRTSRWAAQTVAPLPDAVVVMSCQWESIGRVLPNEAHSSHVGDLQFDQFVESSYVDALTRMFQSGVPKVLWVRCPYFSRIVGSDIQPREMQASRQVERTDALNSVIEKAVAQFPGRACEVPFDEWMDVRTDDSRIRPDGSHYDYENASDVGEEFARMTVEAYKSCANP